MPVETGDTVRLKRTGELVTVADVRERSGVVRVAYLDPSWDASECGPTKVWVRLGPGPECAAEVPTGVNS